MSLLLYRQEWVKHPFYIESLGLNIYSSQELCYVLYHHPFLKLNGFIDSILLDLLRNELDLGFMALKLERWLRSEENPDEASTILLQECDCHSAVEANRFRQKTTAPRGMPPAGFAKGKADYLFGLKQHGKATNIYQDILDVAGETRIDEWFPGRVWYNLGSACTRVFRFDEVVEALGQAYESLKEQSVIEKLYHLAQSDSGVTLHKKCRSFISEEEKARWIEKSKEVRDLSEHIEELEELDRLLTKNSIKRMEGATAMVKAWKREYRSMAQRSVGIPHLTNRQGASVILEQ